LSTPTTSFSFEKDYGKYVFNEAAMETYVSPNVLKRYKNLTKERKPIDIDTADAIAHAMREWASAHGATHFTHWFQPLNGWIAEKHDSFVGTTSKGKAISSFKGKQLIGGEPDASSFPSGGLRFTHEARGYTVWDPQTPAFILTEGGDPTLCIPTCFYSYKGHALDRKIPLLKSNLALEKAGLKLFKVIGERGHHEFFSDSGVEQEFFIIHKRHFRKRPDLMISGRTLQGSHPSKGQELNDHYFAPLPNRATNLIIKVERALWQLGVPIATRHEEVAPNQFEMAPVFERASVASDHNMLMMELLKRTAENYDMQVLLHEKPFANLNGSGKHNNWSVGTNLVPTLMDPGDEPLKNRLFLLTVAAVLRGVFVHQDLLRYCTSGAGNDHRLGGHEAPPAIFSVYLGDFVGSIVRQIAGGKIPKDVKLPDTPIPESILKVDYLPRRPQDNTDRNRTSPVAFTGNKFEVRCVGASQQPAFSNLVLNTITAESYNYLADEIEKEKAAGKSIDNAVNAVLSRTYAEFQNIINDGNGYSHDWPEVAVKKGLLNLKTTPEALEKVNTQKNRDLFEKLNVWTGEEFDANIAIDTERYVHQIHLEAQAFRNLIDRYVLPAGLEMYAKVRSNSEAISKSRIDKIKNLTHSISDKSDKLATLTAHLNSEGGTLNGAKYAQKEIVPLMRDLRADADELESITEAKTWPLPTYEEMLYERHEL
jgi:glutamine synthetase